MRRQKGFTLLEILVALSLFLVGMVSVLQIFPINRKLITQSGEMTQAVFLAQEQIETVRALPYSDLSTGDYEVRHYVAGSADQLGKFERKTLVNYIDAAYANSTVDVGLKKVEVTVYWKQGNLDRQYSLPIIVVNN